MRKSGFTEREWGLVRHRIEEMTAAELERTVKAGSIGNVLCRAVYGSSRRANGGLAKSLVHEALRMWKPLAK